MFYNGYKTNHNLNVNDVLETIGRNIINFDPVKGFNYISNNFSEVIDGVGEAFKSANNHLVAKIDILEDDNVYELIAELAGVNKEDVKILAKDEDSIEIKATKKKPEFAAESNKKITHQERNFGSVTRTINFPKQIDKENISAKWQNGELTIVVPKLKPVEPKEIQISIE